jgi:hypothetical protein
MLFPAVDLQILPNPATAKHVQAARIKALEEQAHSDF